MADHVHRPIAGTAHLEEDIHEDGRSVLTVIAHCECGRRIALSIIDGDEDWWDYEEPPETILDLIARIRALEQLHG